MEYSLRSWKDKVCKKSLLKILLFYLDKKYNICPSTLKSQRHTNYMMKNLRILNNTEHMNYSLTQKGKSLMDSFCSIYQQLDGIREYMKYSL